MKNSIIILADTRQQKDSHITDYLDKHKIEWIRTKLPSADYMAIRNDEHGNIYKDYSILIDTKKDLLEVAGNLCHKEEHERVVREVELAHELGCKEFYFLVASNKSQTIDQLKKWKSPRTKVTGEILLKTMATFSKHHDCKFLIVPKVSMGKQIISILTKEQS